ncbi:MAG: hypothetical protein LBI82_08880 [Dysgonamonadaceae bacterium]|jgi:hypothetical protein|nr:hypothetical protein [Dysgonamonadaceae bacterium]
MKKLLFSFLIGATCLLFNACENSMTEVYTYNINEPVFMDLAEFRSSVNVTTESVEISQQGKMCFYNGYLYISEPGKGIHIIDNRNPAKPQNVGFVELLGNADLAIRNDLLYADALIDLVWFDINNPTKPELKGRLENVFPESFPTTFNDYGCDYSQLYSEDKPKGIIVGWNLVKRTEKVERHNYYDDRLIYAEFSTGAKTSTNQPNMTNGITGSMARFGLYGDYMYAIINNMLTIFDLSGDTPKKAVESLGIWNNVETIFNYEDKLFMGTPTGMLIYSVEDPLTPKYRSFISHVWGCDPVVVENDIAYVTVHAGNNCGQNFNELIIIDVKNVDSPQPIATYTMTKPKGLGIDNGTLFICDEGLKIFDATDPFTLMGKRLAHYSGMEGYDVIPFNNVLMMIAEDGIYQYDYSDLNKIKKLSKIKFGK